MRLLFMGTSLFAVPSLEALHNHGYEIVAVVTQPDRPSGRRREIRFSPVKETANRLSIEVLQPERVRDPESIERTSKLAPLDAIVVVSFGQIIPQAVLDIPKLGGINVHASLLPKYRGAAPIQRSIMNGETVTGVTTMLMDAGLDTGDILLQSSTEIKPDETAGDLTIRLAQIGADLLIDTLSGLKESRITQTPQDDASATTAKSLKREDGLIDWSKSAGEIVDLIRAFNPKPGAFSDLQAQHIKILTAIPASSAGGTFNPGEVIDVNSEGILVAAGSGAVLLTQVQPQSRSGMSAAQFARGARIAPGDAFHAS